MAWIGFDGAASDRPAINAADDGRWPPETSADSLGRGQRMKCGRGPRLSVFPAKMGIAT